MDPSAVAGGSKREDDVMFYEKFKFHFHKVLKLGERWVCADKARFHCKAYLRTIDGEVVFTENTHTHDATSTQNDIADVKNRVAVKRKAADGADDTDEPLRKAMLGSCREDLDTQKDGLGTASTSQSSPLGLSNLADEPECKCADEEATIKQQPDLDITAETELSFGGEVDSIVKPESTNLDFEFVDVSTMTEEAESVSTIEQADHDIESEHDIKIETESIDGGECGSNLKSESQLECENQVKELTVSMPQVPTSKGSLIGNSSSDSQPRDLRQDVRSHAGEKLFMCNSCDYRTSKKGELMAHMRTNTHSMPCKCVIHDLLSRRFSQRTFEEKKEIVAGNPRGAQLSQLNAVLAKQKKIHGKGVTRYFSPSIYKSYKWVCGCSSSISLFCWHCLCFAKPDAKNPWISAGYFDVNNVITACKRHDRSEAHMRAILSYMELKRAFTETETESEQSKAEILRHNQNVSRNRESLKRFIDATCFLVKQELSFREHDESPVTSINHGNYIELAGLIADYDRLLREHFDSASKTFAGLESSIHIDLIDSIKDVVFDQLKKEIDAAEFIAIMIEETSDCPNKSRLATVIHYVDPNGCAQERFLGYADVSSKRSAASVAGHIIKIVSEMGCESKIVSQSYDGASVMPAAVTEAQQRVKCKYPSAIFVHSLAHELNLILTQAMKFIPTCRIFFSTLSGLSSFFSHSTARSLLDTRVKNRPPYVVPAWFNFEENLVETVCHYRVDIMNVFEEIIENESEWDDDAVAKANGYIHFLNSFEAAFLLQLFMTVYNKTRGLNETLKKNEHNISYCFAKVVSTKIFIHGLGDGFFQRLVLGTKYNVLSEFEASRIISNPGSKYQMLFIEILGLLTVSMESRFSDFSQLKFLDILNHKKPNSSSKGFPEENLATFCSAYAGKFDITKLRAELNILYSHQDYTDRRPQEIIRAMMKNGENEVLTEVLKLCKLAVTIPATTWTTERTSLALNRIKSFQKSAIMGQTRLNSLCFLSLEKTLLAELTEPREGYNFHEEVIKKFLAKERRMSYIFK